MIDHYEARHLLAILNFMLCSLIGWSCICRWVQMTAKATRRDVRGAFAVLFAGATASGFSPIFWHEWPGWGDVSLALGVVLVLIVGAREWRTGQPEYAKSGPAPLDSLLH